MFQKNFEKIPPVDTHTHTHMYTRTPNCYSLYQRLIPPLNNNFHVIKQKNFSFSCSHCSCTIFILTSYSLHTQVMPILILINIQYLQIVVFSCGKGLNGQKHSSSDSRQPIKQSPSPQQSLSFLPHPLQ